MSYWKRQFSDTVRKGVLSASEDKMIGKMTNINKKNKSSNSYNNNKNSDISCIVKEEKQ